MFRFQATASLPLAASHIVQNTTHPAHSTSLLFLVAEDACNIAHTRHRFCPQQTTQHCHEFLRIHTRRGRKDMLQIHIDKIEHLVTYGFEESIHNIMGTVRVLTQRRLSSGNSTVIQTARDLSASVVLEFFCESGLLAGTEHELGAVKNSFSERLSMRQDAGTVSYGGTIATVLRHTTSVVIRGNMYAESPIMKNICDGNAVPLESLEEIESWCMLEEPVLVGEVLRLSFVFEENLKKRGIVSDEIIAIIMHDVIRNAQVLLQHMIQHSAVRPMTLFGKDEQSKQHKDSLSKAISRNMVETIVSAVLCMETPGMAKHAHSLFCVNLLELYGEQYMQWGSQTAGSARKRPHNPKKQDALRIIEKQGLLIKTIRKHGRAMVHEQVRNMVTNVSGLFSQNTEMTCCMAEMNLHIDASLNVLCTNQTPQKIYQAVLKYDGENKGIHLLRNKSGFAHTHNTAYSTAPSVPSYISSKSFVTMVECVRGASIGQWGPPPQISPCTSMATGWHIQTRSADMIPSNLWYILKNVKTMLSDVVLENNPRFDIIHKLRHSLAVLYLEIVYSQWVVQYSDHQE